MLSLISRLLRDQEGVTAIEYALIASIISLAVVPLLGTICTSLKTTFSNVASCGASIGCSQ
jgi:pilus assembly protein Flp/PilA